jgi:type IV fimbrial biogenesis protein FimT
MMNHRAGFSLIELLVVILIVGVSLAVGLPSYRIWIENAKIRTTAESIRNGLQLARSEAVRQNATMQFQFNAGGTNSDWRVCPEDTPGNNVFAGCAKPLQEKPAAAAASDIKIYTDKDIGTLTTNLTTSGVSAAANATFTAVGRIQTPNIDLARIDVRNTNLGTNERNLVIVVSTGGAIRVCDPKLNIAYDPRGC